jgi:hypothetical protein
VAVRLCAVSFFCKPFGVFNPGVLEAWSQLETLSRKKDAASILNAAQSAIVMQRLNNIAIF